MINAENGHSKTSTSAGKVKEGNEVCFKTVHLYGRDELVKLANSFMNLICGVSDILFYYSLLPIVSMFLGKLSFFPDFILVITGRRGNFKTTLARMAVLVLGQEELQEIKFFRTPSLDMIEERVRLLTGMNLLIDDIFPASGQYQRAKQSDLLNQLSRFGDKRLYKAGIIITAERIPDQLILSGRDRIFQLDIPNMSTDRKNKLWDKCREIPEDFMTCVSESFKECLIKKTDEVIDDIVRFMEQYNLPDGLNLETRIGIHTEYIELTEFLYKKYFCNESTEQKNTGQFTAKLYEIAIKQHCEICQSTSEDEIDYVREVYKMMTAKNKYLKMEGNRDEYNPDGRNFLVWKGKFYITSDALQYGMQIYMNRTVSLKKISRTLCDAGVLETDAGSANSKRCGLKVRHYIISRSAIELFCRETEQSENI